ncbi:hypothetical protein XM53_15110 [Roseovarius atlanticus]|uniref:Uncharacterized protein n=1 Tax=Roseovarius atlanticus TaxID=1641875 RepID=A0A0T5NSB6_9RHOB|nr:hypothetical protein [Roseovarius atlanticus]KRS11606.1 hypothetical protein XM53_15110 [Roseovarius atlanticus]
MFDKRLWMTGVLFFAVPLAATAAVDKTAVCTETAKIVQVAATERKAGKDAARIKQELTGGAGKVEARLTPMVPPLVDWVFTIDAQEMRKPGAARAVTKRYRDGCLGFEP